MGRDGDLESVFFFRKSLFPLFYLLSEKKQDIKIKPVWMPLI